MIRLRPTLILALTSALLCGCGVAFSSGDQGNDFFLKLDVTGNKTAGSPLTAAVSYETFYPDALDIICELRQGKNTIREIGRGQAPAVENRGPKDHGVPGNFSLDFSVEAPGAYKIECFTPSDESNYVIQQFTVAK